MYTFPKNMYCNFDIGENTSYMFPLGNIEDTDNKMMIYTGMIENKKGKIISDPYIKILKYIPNDDFDEITHVCRLNMLRPEYITGLDENYKLTKEELDIVWNYLVCSTNDDCLTVPNRWYSAVKYILKELKYSHKKYKSYLVIDQIPNYKLLEWEGNSLPQ